MEVVIYHNPKCSKSRNIEPRIIEYLQSPPDREQLSGILRMLDLSPRDLVRTGENSKAAIGHPPEQVLEIL